MLKEFSLQQRGNLMEGEGFLSFTEFFIIPKSLSQSNSNWTHVSLNIQFRVSTF
jgi:hypothetical protein